MSRRSARQLKVVKGTQGPKATPNSAALPGAVQSQPQSVGGVQWPSAHISGAPIPDMPRISPTQPPLQNYGATGTAIFSGIISSEEYNPDFYWRDGIKIYEQMLRNDGQIAAIRQMVELPLRRAPWAIEPASDDPKDIEIASFIESCLFHDMSYVTTSGRTLYQKWDDILRHALMMIWYGFIPFEMCYKVEDGWVKWARWIPLLPRTVWRWWVGADNELAGIQQWTFKDYSYQFVNIPADKLMLFVHRQEGNNFDGLPLLRNVYKHWFYKCQFEKIEAIGIERNAVVPPIVRLPANHTAYDLQQAQAIGQNMRVNELMSVTLPFGWDLEYPKNMQKYAESTQPAIQYHDVMIARAVLAQFINLGSTETGSYALADTQVQTFLSSLQAVAEYIEDVINSEAIPTLVNYNYDNVAVYPKIKCGKLQGDLNVISTALKNLTGSQPLLMPYPELNDWIADQLGIPTPPRSPVENTNPTAPSTPDRPDTNPNSHKDANATEVEGKKDNNEPDNGGVGDASLRESLQEARLFREAMAVIDAVERGRISAEQEARR